MTQSTRSWLKKLINLNFVFISLPLCQYFSLISTCFQSILLVIYGNWLCIHDIHWTNNWLSLFLFRDVENDQPYQIKYGSKWNYLLTLSTGSSLIIEILFYVSSSSIEWRQCTCTSHDPIQYWRQVILNRWVTSQMMMMIVRMGLVFVVIDFEKRVVIKF